MDNKDEKTFKDLFSNSTTKFEKQNQTFSDILNNSNIEEKNNSIEKKDEIFSKLTFDNLFDKIPTEEQNQDSILINDEKTAIETPNEPIQTINFNSIFDKQEEPNQASSNNDEANSSIEPITQIEIPQENIESETISSEEQTETTIETPNEPIQTINFNSIFDNQEEQPQEPIVNENLESQLINNNPFFDEEIANKEIVSTDTNMNLGSTEKIEEKVEDVNPFFTPENSQKNDLNKEIETEKSELANNEEHQKEINFEINPFMNVKEAPQENPFFGPTNKNGESNNNSQISILNNNKDYKELEKNEDLAPKSTSPFFEEEKKSEENPFFQNKLNLIENQNPNNQNTTLNTTNTKHYSVKVVKKKEPLIKFIIGVLSYALFIWLLLIGVTLLVYVLDIKIRAAKGDFSSPKFNAYVVLTGSMLPEIQVFDVVVTKKVDASELKEGDVITFASADSRFLGTIITHRIIKKNPPTETTGYTFQTQGDNNNVADNALVPENNIYGKVILKIPKLGYLQEFLATDGGWIIVILIPCLTVISYDTVKLIKGIKRKKYKNIKVQK